MKLIDKREKKEIDVKKNEDSNINKDKIKRIIKIIIECLMILQILISIVFIIKNITYIPEYGDTNEYLELSQTLKLDGYRPFVYPYFLRGVNKISTFTGINNIVIIYFVQNMLSLLACGTIVSALKDTLDIKIDKKHFALYTLYLFSIPMNLHFNMSVLSDGFATSFIILFIASVLKYLNKKQIKYAIMTFVSAFLASNIRSERMYFIIFVLGILMIYEGIKLIQDRKNKKTERIKERNKEQIKNIIVFFILIILTFVSSKICVKVFQPKGNATRGQPTMEKFMYERIVSNTLPEIYEYLPEDIKQIVSYEDALNSASHPNKYCRPYHDIYKVEGSTAKARQIIYIALRRNLPDICANILGDFTKNVFAPYYIIANNTEGVYQWSVSRMQGKHYLYTDMYLLYFSVLFVIINIAVFIYADKSKIFNKKLLAIYAYIFISATFFSCLSGFNFHIRYAMAAYVLEITLIIMSFADINVNKNEQ